MHSYVREVKDYTLFAGIGQEDLGRMLECLGCYPHTYKKGEFIALADEQVKSVGIVLQGIVHMLKEDIWGNRTIFALIEKGGLLGETFVCGSSKAATVTFFSATDTKVLYLPFDRVLHSCNSVCEFHQKLIENMVTMIADKNLMLMEKAEITSKKTLREKILTYLSLRAQAQGNNRIETQLGRLELADYLCADRSALTRELNKMRDDGLITFEKNVFYLLE